MCIRDRYEATQENIQVQEEKVEEESSSINSLLSEKSAKQQEVQSLVATTGDSINSYISQILSLIHILPSSFGPRNS